MTNVPAFIVVIVVATFAGSAAAQTETSFTYQGGLKDSGSPANGSLGMNYEEEQRMAEELERAREQAGEMRRNAQ